MYGYFYISFPFYIFLPFVGLGHFNNNKFCRQEPMTFRHCTLRCMRPTLLLRAGLHEASREARQVNK